MIAMLGWNVNEMNILFGKENKGFGISRVSSTIFLSVGSVDVDVEELSISCWIEGTTVVSWKWAIVCNM